MSNLCRPMAVRAAFVAAGASAALLASVAPAWAATASGTPHTALTDGSVVHLTGTGFGSKLTLGIVECSALTSTGCDKKRFVLATSDAGGNFSANFTVHTGTIGDGSCLPGSTTCYIAVDDVPAGKYPAFFSIAFAAAATPTPTPRPTIKPSTRPTSNSKSSGSGGSSGSSSSPSSSGGSSAVSVSAGTGGFAGRHGPDIPVTAAVALLGVTGVGFTARRLRRSRSRAE